MRTAAKHVDEQTLAYMKTHAITGPWPSGRASSGVYQLQSCQAPAWYVTPAGWLINWVPNGLPFMLRRRRRHLSPDQQERLTSTLRMAERMGAKVVHHPGELRC